ncbi:hypothetical protein ACHQM5_005879 [Ranunculus cassubicifolius]
MSKFSPLLRCFLLLFICFLAVEEMTTSVNAKQCLIPADVTCVTDDDCTGICQARIDPRTQGQCQKHPAPEYNMCFCISNFCSDTT